MRFDPDKTYWQSLKIVARALIRWPVRYEEWSDFFNGAKEILCFFAGAIYRITALILLPISAPLITLLVQAERRRIVKVKEEAMMQAVAHYEKLIRNDEKQGEKA